MMFPKAAANLKKEESLYKRPPKTQKEWPGMLIGRNTKDQIGLNFPWYFEVERKRKIFYMQAQLCVFCIFLLPDRGWTEEGKGFRKVKQGRINENSWKKQKTDWLIEAAVMWRGSNPAGSDRNTLSYSNFSSLNSHSSMPAITSCD